MQSSDIRRGGEGPVTVKSRVSAVNAFRALASGSATEIEELE